MSSRHDDRRPSPFDGLTLREQIEAARISIRQHEYALALVEQAQSYVDHPIDAEEIRVCLLSHRRFLASLMAAGEGAGEDEDEGPDAAGGARPSGDLSVEGDEP